MTESYLCKKRFQKPILHKVNETAIKRFFMTLIINQMWRPNNSVWQTSKEFGVDRGFI